jgi:GNAT superfamily N-acetyltransferase
MTARTLDLGVAGTEDLPQLVALLGMLFSQEAEFAPDDAKQARALGKILSDETVGRIYVAREGGRVVAMASLLYSISTAEGGLAASFEDLIVLPDRRGRGIASALVRFIIREARRQGVLRLTLLTDSHNKRAQGLYAKAGFTPSSMLAMRLQLTEEDK